VPGPRDDWFDAAALESLCAQDWLVTPRSNRVGMRLAGEPLSRSREGELASEGTMAGALQIPPEGQPVLFLADHPITGGYPVIGVVVDHQLDLAAQIPIGGRIRFRWAPGYGLPANSSPDSPAVTEDKVSN
jgi:allophanate hydrolase subunit 2